MSMSGENLVLSFLESVQRMCYKNVSHKETIPYTTRHHGTTADIQKLLISITYATNTSLLPIVFEKPEDLANTFMQITSI